MVLYVTCQTLKYILKTFYCLLPFDIPSSDLSLSITFYSLFYSHSVILFYLLPLSFPVTLPAFPVYTFSLSPHPLHSAL